MGTLADLLAWAELSADTWRAVETQLGDGLTPRAVATLPAGIVREGAATAGLQVGTGDPPEFRGLTAVETALVGSFPWRVPRQSPSPFQRAAGD